MDKKNTMLLTVIAIATLLVAVIGATFAYFGVTGSNTASTAALTTTTDQVGTVALAGDVTAIHINTIAGDFAQTAAPKTMWAKAGNSASTLPASDYENSEVDHVIYTLTSSNGSNSAIYKCTVKVDVDTTIPQGKSFVEGEYVIYVKAGTAVATIDLSGTGNDDVTKTFVVYLTGNTTSNITASAKLVNTTSEQQSRISNASFATTFAINSTNGFTCETASSASAGNSVS